jgi:hypothetical protein
MVMNRTLGATLLAGALTLGGCQSPPRIDIEEQWADTMGRLSMFGFYPQSEDVQVGDVFLHVPRQDGGPPLPRFNLTRLSSFAPNDVLNQLQGQQGRRGQLPPASNRAGDRLTIMPLPAPAAAGTVRQITATADCGGFNIGHADEARCPVRMQRATIPGLQVGRITQGQLGAAGLLGNFGANLGLGSSSETAVNIRLRNVQDLSLDAWRLAKLRNEGWQGVVDLIWAEDLLALLREMRPELLADACNGNAAALARAGVEVMMINRVVYAGGFEYGFTDNASTAIRAAVDLQSVLPGQPQAPVIPSLPGAPTRPADPAPTTTPQAAAGARLASVLQGLTGHEGGGGRAGVSMSFGIGSYGNLSLNEDFNRLVAVGAGSRLRFGFHEMLSGRLLGRPSLPAPDGEPGTFEAFRYRKAAGYCAAALGGRFDAAGLARAMGVPPGG